MSYFSPGLPIIITEPGQYVTRSGEVVTVDVVKQSLYADCRGRYSNGVEERWNCSGRIWTGQECQNDILFRSSSR